MKHLTLLLAFFLLTSCANVGTKQAACEEQYNKFVDIFACTKNALADDKRLQKDPRTKLYLLKGEQLAEQLQNGKITEIDAKTEWQKLFVELAHNKDMEGYAARAANPYKPIKQTHCVPIGNSVSCTTY